MKPGEPGWTGQQDQVQAGMRDVGRNYGSLYAGMREKGASEFAAIAGMVAFIVSSQLNASVGKKGGSEG